jgi:hypothetical protein
VRGGHPFVDTVTSIVPSLPMSRAASTRAWTASTWRSSKMEAPQNRHFSQLAGELDVGSEGGGQVDSD